MSVNQFMHPRNIYRKPPNFKELAIVFPEFRKFAQQDVSGKVAIDFKNQEALRALTCCLLKRDFELEVEIPLNRLIPTLPLRLNYLLWIEDLLLGISEMEHVAVKGIDIGTGSCCIYALLAAKTKGWNMLATEVDKENFENAQKNVLTNKLNHLITVKQTQEGVIFRGVLNENETYDFSMCNPPFFSSEQELDSSVKSRSAQRTPPHSVKTGSPGEVVVEGGEVAFVQQMMHESQELSGRVRIYTTMIGHKSSVAPLKEELKKLDVENFAETTFCQGHTTRWGLAWSFDPVVRKLQTLTQNLKPKKEKPPMQYTVPIPKDLKEYNVTEVTEKLKTLFTELQIEYKQIKKSTQFSVMEISARKNTWSHQRRRKRKEKLLAGDSSSKADAPSEVSGITVEEEESLGNKKAKLDSSEESETVGDAPSEIAGIKDSSSNADASSEVVGIKDSCSKADAPSEVAGIKDSSSKSDAPSEVAGIKDSSSKADAPSEVAGIKRTVEEKESVGNKKTKLDSSEESGTSKDTETTGEGNQQTSYLMKALVTVKRIAVEVVISISPLVGDDNREAAHQILQYIKNNLKLPC